MCHNTCAFTVHIRTCTQVMFMPGNGPSLHTDLSLMPRTGVETSEKDPEEDAQVPGGRRGGQRDNLQDCDGQRCQK